MQTFSMDLLRKFKLVKNPTEYIHQLEQSDKIAVAVSRELSYLRPIFGNYNFDPFTTIYCFEYPENIHDYWLKILVKKKFPLMNELNRFIQCAIEGGLVAKWMKDYKSMKEKTLRYEYRTMNEEILIFTAVIYWAMLSVALLILIIEQKIYEKMMQETNVAKIWRYIEMYVDPNRYFLNYDLVFE